MYAVGLFFDLEVVATPILNINFETVAYYEWSATEYGATWLPAWADLHCWLPMVLGL